ncbi:MAG: ankyrin repeat domain-containing protein [Sedimentisphaerales bacterium]|nr:ankyrin repeat domain-containing protein [Sedimentisphaerales bacterium]
MDVTARVPCLLRLATKCWWVLLIYLSGCTYDMAPLHTAIRKDNTKRALEFIRKGKHINERDPVMHQETMGKTPLYCAAARGQYDVVVALLEAGADVRMEEEREGKLPIHAAALNGQAQIAALLAEKGADVNAGDDYGRRPLTFAANIGHAATVRVLLARGALANARETGGVSALSAAARGGHLEAVQALVQAQAEINAADDGGWTALMRAAAGPHAEVAEYLVRNGAVIDAVTPDGWTALMLGASKGDLACVRMLVESGAALNMRCTDCNWTALHFAAYQDCVDIADYLIDGGARADPVFATERDFYASAVSSKLFARHYEENGNRDAALGCYTTAAECYEQARAGFKERSREIGGKISSANLAAFGRFVAAVAVSAVASAASPSINTGSTSHQMVFYPTGVPSADTTDLSSLKKDCDRRVKESERCAEACRQIIESYQGDILDARTQKRLEKARETLGFS